MPIVFDTSALLRPAFLAVEFVATKWDGPDVKAKFANDLCRFIAADYKECLFTKTLYHRLALSFGHIAHCNRDGFYGTFFHDLAGKVVFLEQTLSWRCFGEPAHTYCDVERAIIRRLRTCNVLEAHRALRAAEIEGAERELLRRLQAKYEKAGETALASILYPGRPASQHHKPQPARQATLL